jgi:hypothetical protein
MSGENNDSSDDDGDHILEMGILETTWATLGERWNTLVSCSYSS